MMQSNKTALNFQQWSLNVSFCSVHMFKTNSRLITQLFTKHTTERSDARRSEEVHLSTHYYTPAKALKMLSPFAALRKLSLLKY